MSQVGLHLEELFFLAAPEIWGVSVPDDGDVIASPTRAGYLLPACPHIISDR
ncbi:hypothetical protein [Streptomyces sp. NPDC127084]|uniref:hypothetical protein n=1 Tax=Streptomyces sp. NPDC127084 TaxID=3347133 RepID=UPI00364A0E3E